MSLPISTQKPPLDPQVDPTRFVYGGVAFDVHTGPDLEWVMGKEHRRFRAPYGAGPVALDVRLSVARASGITVEGDRAIHWRWDGARVHASTRGASLEARELDRRKFAATALVDPDASGCSSLCTALVGVLLERAGGVVLHASAVEVDGRAVLFIGPSGAGKTTTANHCGGARWFAKDRAAVFPTHEGWQVAPMCGGDEVDLPVSAERILPLGGILRVERSSTRVSVRTKPSSGALTVLRESVQTAPTSPELEVMLMERLLQLASAARVGEIEARLGENPLTEIRAWLRS